MRKQGKVFRWDSAKGFGFIRSPDTSQEIFFHIRDYRGNAAPSEGEAVWFEEIQVGGKGPRGMSVQPVVSASNLRARGHTSRGPGHSKEKIRSANRRAQSIPESISPLRILLPMLFWMALIGWGVMEKRIPPWAIGVGAIFNLVTFSVYAHDKYAAQNGRWRVNENTLHSLSLIGGWPGAWLAQQTMRHKSRKVSFRTSYWMTVVAHFALLLGWLLWLQPRLLKFL